MRSTITKVLLSLVFIFIILVSLSDNLKIDMFDNQYPVMIKFDSFKIFFLVMLVLANMTILRILFGIWYSFNKKSFVEYFGDPKNSTDRFGIFLITYVLSLMMFFATSDFILSYFFTF